jgi:hypothetical protein
MLRAQNLPAGPVRIIVGFAPGGGTDILGARHRQKLGEMWKTQVIVENKAGASGTIAADYVAKQPADGNTLLMAHINSQAITPGLQKVNYDPAKDFAPIVLVGVTPNLLICNENQPAKTVKDWSSCAAPTPARSASARPAPAARSTSRWRCSCWPRRSRPSTCRTRARAPMLTDLIGGTIQYSFDTDDGRDAAREERQGDRHRADAPGAREGLCQRADRWPSRASPASRPPPGTAWPARPRCRWPWPSA